MSDEPAVLEVGRQGESQTGPGQSGEKQTDEARANAVIAELKGLLDRGVINFDDVLHRLSGLDLGLFKYWYYLFDRGSEINTVDAIPTIHRLYYANPSERVISVLDVGAGTGGGAALLQRLHSRFGPSHLKLDVTALDLEDGRIVQFARYVHPGLRILFADIFTLDTVHDLVFCSNVIEHIPNPEPFVRRMQALARDYVVCITPFAEQDRIPGHVNTIDMAFIYRFAPVSVEVYTNIGWKMRGQCVIFVLKGLAGTEAPQRA